MARRYHEIKGPAEFTAKEMYSDKNRPSNEELENLKTTLHRELEKLLK